MRRTFFNIKQRNRLGKKKERYAMKIFFDTRSIADYETFLNVRKLPSYRFIGGLASIPDEYASQLGLDANQHTDVDVDLHPSLFDYQRDIARLAIEKRKYAVFADCGLGKTFMILEFAKHAARVTGKRVLIVSPLMVVNQTIEEAGKFYPGISIGRIPAANLEHWLNGDEDYHCQIGVTNYESIREGLFQSKLGGLILDESSMLKSHYGAWGTRLIELGQGLDWKLCATGTPAPNDRIEFANHAVFLDRSRTVNEFLATYFINRGETQNRWELKHHALKPFYRSLSDWSIFLTNPATYGWKDNVGVTPPINIHIDHIDLTETQRKAAQSLTGNLLTTSVGGIASRGKLSQIAKGKNGMETNKPAFIRAQVDSWPDESTIIWCHYNDEQELMEKTFPEAVSITGATKESDREESIRRFKSGEVKVMITKLKILGFGLNLQVCTRQIFSGLKDSYEEFYQGVKRSNRIGSTKPLNVHIPVTELEYPFVENVLRKSARVEQDTKEQEELFKECGYAFIQR
jgi:superfamily II DNA or RNA helicase